MFKAITIDFEEQTRMQNRQKDEIIRDILTVSNGGARISHIMFKAYLSHGQAKGYLGELIGQGFMEYDSIERTYCTASKGMEYLQAAEKMSEMLAVTTRSMANKSIEAAFQF